MNSNSSAVSNQSNKKRVIIISAVCALIVLGLLIAVISVAVQKNNAKTANTNVSGEIALDSTADSNANGKPEKSSSDPKSENLPPVSNSQDSGSTQSAPAVSGSVTPSSNSSNDTFETSSELPATGPTDLLPLVLLAGMTTVYLVSLYYSRSTR